jgi:DNA-binding transcriptional regulator YhcF (GntR family)
MSRDVSPPYLRIVEDIRRRIEEGDLQPGERLPSTRRVAKKWRVSLATASKALRELAREGAIVATPRVGAVVARSASHPKPAPRPPDLTRARIVAAGLEIADVEGLAALSIRGVAAKVGVPVMSLYRHVSGKEELLGLMTEAALLEDPLPAKPLDAWRPHLEQAARAFWRVYRRHPWMARVITILRPLPLPASLAHANFVLAGLRGHGFDAATMMQMHVTVYAFIQGLAVNLEAEAEAQGDTGVDDEAWMQSKLSSFDGLARSGRFPAFAAMLDELSGGFDLPLDAVFELGLGTLLDGFEALVGGRSAARR